MSRPFLMLVALIVAVDLYHGAIAPLELSWAVNVALGLLLGVGVAYYVDRSHAADGGGPANPPA